MSWKGTVLIRIKPAAFRPLPPSQAVMTSVRSVTPLLPVSKQRDIRQMNEIVCREENRAILNTTST
jgi:hypothetical protein